MEAYNVCQSCGMPLDQPDLFGTEKDGSKSTVYCKYCYRDGKIVNPDMTFEEMKTLVRTKLNEQHMPEDIISQAVAGLSKLRRWLGIAILWLPVISIFSLISCRKTDVIKFDPRNGNTEFKQCLITQLDGTGGGGEGGGVPFHIQMNITYNSRRDPVVGQPLEVNSSSKRLLFYYDTRGRLTSFAGAYDNGGFETWHNYTYDRTGRITGDSTYIFGRIDDLASSLGKRHSDIFYDRLNRVVMEIRIDNGNAAAPDTVRYRYDAAGNLDGDQIPYDHKANPFLTNKIWRFVARDYSVNNQGKASVYNDHGLPTLFVPSAGDTWYGAFWAIFGDVVTIQYDCRDDGAGGH